MVEGPKLVDLARAGGWVDAIYAEADIAPDYDGAIVVAPGVLAKVLDTVTPQGVCAVARMPTVDLASVDVTSGVVLVLAGIADPGNAGTLIRTAVAAGAAGVLFCDESVDPFSPKCVRAAAGSTFQVPVVSGGGSVSVLQHLGSRRVRRLGTAARAGVPYDEADLRAPLALVLGNEAHGLPAGVAEQLDGWVHLPMAGTVESLNVAVAGSVVLFEAARQARRADGEAGGARAR